MGKLLKLLWFLNAPVDFTEEEKKELSQKGFDLVSSSKAKLRSAFPLHEGSKAEDCIEKTKKGYISTSDVDMDLGYYGPRLKNFEETKCQTLREALAVFHR